MVYHTRCLPVFQLYAVSIELIIPVYIPVYLLYPWQCCLANVFRYFHAWTVSHLCQLVHTVKGTVALARNKGCTHTESIYGGFLADKAFNDMLIQLV